MGRGRWKRGDFAGSASAWQTGYSAAGAALQAGVNAPKRSPTQAAIANANTMVTNWNAATAGGAQSTWAQGLQRSGDAGWAAGMKQFAATGLAAKAAKGAPHVAAFAQQYGPAAVQQAASLTPRADFATNQQRSLAMQNWAHSNRGKYRHLWRGSSQ